MDFVRKEKGEYGSWSWPQSEGRYRVVGKEERLREGKGKKIRHKGQENQRRKMPCCKVTNYK